MAINWGSVADWLAAVGGVGSAGAATTFYFLDRKRAGIAEINSKKKQATFDTNVATHLYNLLGDITDVSGRYVGPGLSFMQTVAVRAEFAAFATTATRMQGLQGLSIDRFMDLCDLLEAITDRRIEDKDVDGIRNAVAHVHYVAGRMKEELAQELRLDS